MFIRPFVKYLLFALILGFIITSCKNKSTEVKVIDYNKISIVMDKAIYAPGDKAQLTIHNDTEMDLILDNCGPEPGFDFQKQIGGKWNTVLTLDCMGDGQPFPIPAGARFKHELTIPQIIGNGSHEGKYRLLFWLKKKQGGDLLDKDQRASDPFYIK